MSGEVFRDAWGIPHLRADSLGRLAWLQGREVATTRSRQIELERLRSEGRLAEVVGAAGLEWDRLSRRLGGDDTARTAYARLDDETQQFLTSFAAGVEVGLRDRPAFDGPPAAVDGSHWRPWTPIGVFLVQQALFANFPGALWRQRVRTAYGDPGLAAFDGAAYQDSGSNAFGVGGERTRSGRPLVAGDPHRVFEVPNVYAQVRLCCTDPDDSFDVAGYTFPGVPGVQHFAQAESVAWAITNAMADYQAVTRERLERRGSGVWALGPGGWDECEVRTETVGVWGASAVDVEVVVTPRGPVVVGGPGEPESFSVRTASRVLGDAGFGALVPLLRARTADDVDAAFERWVEPVNNVVIADSTGELRHRVAGRVPLGKTPTEPLDAAATPTTSTTSTTAAWVAPLPRIPVVDDVVVTANDCAEVPTGTTGFDEIGSGFATPYRASRIRALLTGRDDWTAASLRAVSLDVLIGDVEVLLAAVARVDGLGGAGARLQRQLAGWDREMRVDSTLAAAFVGVRDAVVAGLCDGLPDLAGPSPHGRLYDASSALGPKVLSHLDALLTGRAAALGLDVDAVVRRALETVADAPATTWGARHAFHPLTAAERLGLDDETVQRTGLGRTPTVDASPVAGDDQCVAATHAVPGSAVTSRGPVARYVWDLADRGRSLWSVPLGSAQDGPHAEDQFAAWYGGDLVPVVVDWDALVPE